MTTKKGEEDMSDIEYNRIKFVRAYLPALVSGTYTVSLEQRITSPVQERLPAVNLFGQDLSMGEKDRWLRDKGSKGKCVGEERYNAMDGINLLKQQGGFFSGAYDDQRSFGTEKGQGIYAAVPV